jgi:hypothetical protein
MKRFLTPITVAAAAGALALGAAGGAVAASAASSPNQPNHAQIRAKCENRARVKLRDAFRAERQKRTCGGSTQASARSWPSRFWIRQSLTDGFRPKHETES